MNKKYINYTLPSIRRCFALTTMYAVAYFSLNAISPNAQAAGVDVSRHASWINESTVFSGNGHGSTVNPDTQVWRYYHQAGAQETIDPTQWTNTFYTNNKFSLADTGGGDVGYIDGQSDHLRTYWNVYQGIEPAAAFKPSWAITSYTEVNPAGGIYDISGKLVWTLDYAGGSSGVTVSIVKISGTDVTSLFTEELNESATGTYTIFDSSSATPLPESLSGIVLQQGESIAFGIRGADYQFRMVQLNDQDLKLTYYSIPESSSITWLIGGIVLGLITLKVRRKNQS